MIVAADVQGVLIEFVDSYHRAGAWSINGRRFHRVNYTLRVAIVRRERETYPFYHGPAVSSRPVAAFRAVRLMATLGGRDSFLAAAQVKERAVVGRLGSLP